MIIVEDRVAVDKNGFLEASEFCGLLFRCCPDVLKVATELNKAVYNFYDCCILSPEKEIDVFLLVTLEKIHKDYQSIIILLSRGLQSQAKAILRNLLEKDFILNAVIKDENFYELWQKDQNRQHNRIVNNIERGKTFFPADKAGAHDLWKYDEFEKVSTLDWAKYAGKENEYYVVYSLLCADIHHSRSGVEHDIGRIEGFVANIDIAPETEDLAAYLMSAMHYLINTVQSVGNYLYVDTEWTEEYEKQLDNLSSRYIS